MYVQRVFPDTARHAGWDSVRHVSRPDWRIALGRGLRMEIWRFANNHFGSPRSQVNKLQDLRVMRHVRVFLRVPLPLKHRRPIELRLDQ